MLSGDLSTMALADVLQWVDQSRGRALVTIERTDGRISWLMAEERVVVAASAPFLEGALTADAHPEPGPGTRAATLESVLDLFLSSDGTFELSSSAATPPSAVPLSMPVQFLVMEGLRNLDEWPRIRDTYPNDEARIAATDVEPEDLDTVQSAIHRLALGAPALGEARLVLGLSRPALLRRVDELRQRGFVEVEGTPHGPDLEGTLLEQAQILLRERQYAEAAHVFRSILASNPDDGRALRLLREAERLQLAAAYELFGPTDIVAIGTVPDEGVASLADRAVLDCLVRPRSVAVLALVSPLRELETLQALRRLASKGYVSVETAD